MTVNFGKLISNSKKKSTKDGKLTPLTYNEWNESKSKERIKHFLCRAKCAEGSFLSMAACFKAVQYTQEQIEILLKAQDTWCSEQLSKSEKEKVKKAKN